MLFAFRCRVTTARFCASFVRFLLFLFFGRQRETGRGEKGRQEREKEREGEERREEKTREERGEMREESERRKESLGPPGGGAHTPARDWGLPLHLPAPVLCMAVVLSPVFDHRI